MEEMILQDNRPDVTLTNDADCLTECNRELTAWHQARTNDPAAERDNISHSGLC
jgi:hypothetical protein